VGFKFVLLIELALEVLIFVFEVFKKLQFERNKIDVGQNNSEE
jgi:hypothetical protein